MALHGLQDSREINKALFLQANRHIKIERQKSGRMTMASIERISKIKRRTSIKPSGEKSSSSAVEGASKIIEIERIIMHDGFAYYFPTSLLASDLKGLISFGKLCSSSST